MPRKPDPDLRRWWRDLLAQFDPQRHSVAQFCRSHDICVASFYKWRKTLDTTTTPRLIPVQVRDQTPALRWLPAQTATAAVVRIGSHTVIEIADHQAERLTEIIIALARTQAHHEALAQPGDH